MLMRVLVVSLEFHHLCKPTAGCRVETVDLPGMDSELEGPKLNGICDARLRTVSAGFLITRLCVFIVRSKCFTDGPTGVVKETDGLQYGNGCRLTDWRGIGCGVPWFFDSRIAGYCGKVALIHSMPHLVKKYLI